MDSVMTYTQIVTGPNGESRFEDIELRLPLDWDAQHLRRQPVPAGRTSPHHPEPMPSFATVLSGWIEITSSLGVMRRFGPGHGMLFLDTEGKGHAFVVAPEPTVLMIVRLQDGVALPAGADLSTPSRSAAP